MKTLFFAVALASTVALGQNPLQTGTVTGTVTDVSGSVIPGVRVTASGTAGNAAAVTDVNGRYTLENLPAGEYTVTAALSGFFVSKRGISVGSGESVALAFTLKVQVPRPSPFEREREVDIRANSQTQQGAVIQYRGNVQMSTDAMEVTADELDFDPGTRTASARGNVTIKVLPIRPRIIPLAND